MARRPLFLGSLIAILLIAVAVGVAACGQSAAPGGADPAAAVPPGVAFYLEATLRPSGGLRDDALAAAGRILHTPEPAARIRSLLQQAFASGSGPKIDYARDVEPWLGDKAGLWVAPPARADGRPGFAAVIDVRDADVARKRLEGFARADGQKLSARKAGSHGYEVASDGTALAAEGDYAFVGTESEVRRGLSTLDGDGLASSSAYRGAIAPLRDDRLGLYYLDLRGLVDAAMRSNPAAAQSWSPLEGALANVIAGGAQAGSFSADGDRLTIESVSRGGGLAGQLGVLTGGQASPLLAELPGNAWAALAAPDAGTGLRTAFNRIAGVLGGVAATQSLEHDYGIDLEQDVFSWMGDMGVFARGTTPATVDGAVVFTVTDQQRATAAFGKFVGLARTRGGADPQPVRVAGADSAFSFRLRGTSKPIVLARGLGRMVVAKGTDAAAQALSPSATLRDAPSYAAAKSALDGAMDPSLVVAIAPILALVESSGTTAASDPGYFKAKPYLQALDVLAMGSKRDGDLLRARVAVGLR